MTPPIKYLKEVGREAKRIRWPSREQLWPSIGVVIVIAVFVALFIALWDLTAKNLIDLLRNAFGGN
jgi:preprotein translocase SecE subunit